MEKNNETKTNGATWFLAGLTVGLILVLGMMGFHSWDLNQREAKLNQTITEWNEEGIHVIWWDLNEDGKVIRNVDE